MTSLALSGVPSEADQSWKKKKQQKRSSQKKKKKKKKRKAESRRRVHPVYASSVRRIANFGVSSLQRANRTWVRTFLPCGDSALSNIHHRHPRIASYGVSSSQYVNRTWVHTFLPYRNSALSNIRHRPTGDNRLTRKFASGVPSAV